jgi:hypothetical protein
MIRHRLLAVVAVLGLLTVAGAAPGDLSGTWVFSVDLDGGGHGDPTFVFKQEGDKLTGSYTGPMGERKVTGTVTASKAVFGFQFTNDDGQNVKATYTGTLETPDKMTGTIEFEGGPKGKWTATRKSS